MSKNTVTLSPEHSAYWLRCQSNPLAVMNTGSEEMDAFVGQSMGVQSAALKSEVKRDACGVVRKAEEAPAALPGMKF